MNYLVLIKSQLCSVLPLKRRLHPSKLMLTLLKNWIHLIVSNCFNHWLCWNSIHPSHPHIPLKQKSQTNMTSDTSLMMSWAWVELKYASVAACIRWVSRHWRYVVAEQWLSSCWAGQQPSWLSFYSNGCEVLNTNIINQTATAAAAAYSLTGDSTRYFWFNHTFYW